MGNRANGILINTTYSKKNLYNRINSLLSLANVDVNGSRPWDIHILNDNFYCTVLKDGFLGLGESYMEGWWDVKELDECICRLLKANLQNKVKTLHDIRSYFQALILNLQTPKRSYVVGKKHYDIGNELYEHMLDKRMI